MILTEIQVFVAASILLIVQFLAASFMKTLHPSVGLIWGLSPRDEEKETPLLAKRAGRAAYFVIHVIGIPYALRTITWMISLFGLGMMARALILVF